MTVNGIMVKNLTNLPLTTRIWHALMMRMLLTIVTGLAVSFLAASRPFDSKRASSLNVRDGSSHDLGDMGNAAVSNWTNTQLTQLGVVIENLELYFV